MRKQKLFYLVCFSFFIAIFSSCFDNTYDLSNEKIDPNVVWSSGGINVPFGNVEKFFIFERIGYEDIRYTSDGSLYIEFEDDLDTVQFQIPRYFISAIGPLSTDEIPLDLVPSSFSGSNIIKPLWSRAEPVIIHYVVPKPEFENTDDNEWSIEPDGIAFDTLMIDLKFALKGFRDLVGNAKINLHMTFPEGFEVEGVSKSNRKITKSFPFNTTNPDADYVLPEAISVKSYKYKVEGVSDIRIDLDIEPLGNFSGTVSDPKFKMTLTAINSSRVIQYIQGHIKGKTSVIDEITGFDELKKSLGDDAVLQIANPSLFLSISTDLGANFHFFIDELDAHNVAPISLVGTDGLWFTKPDAGKFKTTSFYVAPHPELSCPPGTKPEQLKTFPVNTLFVSIPERINYHFSLNVDDPTVTLRSGLTLSGNYKFTLPFSFDLLKVKANIEPIDLGKDFYKQVLQNVESKLTIQADTVIVSTKNFNVGFKATINFLDDQREAIANLSPKPVTLKDGVNAGTFSITFSKEDIEKMEKARFMDIEIILQGKGALNKNDFIEIKKIRLISDGGYRFEINL